MHYECFRNSIETKNSTRFRAADSTNQPPAGKQCWYGTEELTRQAEMNTNLEARVEPDGRIRLNGRCLVTAKQYSVGVPLSALSSLKQSDDTSLQTQNLVRV